MFKQIIGGTLLLSAAQLWANTFTLTSNDIANGEMLSNKYVFNGFGCEGENISPHLAWSGAPKETKAFAVFAYDPDAPTGSGWWHWQVTDLPASTSELAAGAGSSSSPKLPEGAVQINNDFGVNGFGGACPPKGHGIHRYQFTVFALAKPLGLKENTKSAVAGYMVNANTLAKATIEAVYKRD